MSDTEVLCDHEPDVECGCWVDDEGVTQPHAFRFFQGERVQWGQGQWPGVTGTVDRGYPERLFVIWDDHCTNWAPTCLPVNYEISRVPKEAECSTDPTPRKT